MNIHGFDIDDGTLIAGVGGIPAAAAGVAGWWAGRKRAEAKASLDARLATADDRRVGIDQFKAIVDAYEREVARFREVVVRLENKLEAVSAANLALKEENIGLRAQIGILNAKLEALGHPPVRRTAGGRREGDPIPVPPTEPGT